MNWRLNGFGVLLVAGMISPAAQAQDVVEVAPSNFPSKMEEQGQPASNSKGEIKKPDVGEVNELLMSARRENSRHSEASRTTQR